MGDPQDGRTHRRVSEITKAGPDPATNTMIKAYISGPMTGLPDLNFPAFHRAATQLRAMGVDAINPAEINSDPKADWHECIRADIRALCDCTHLVLLPGWEDSKGAHLELHVAHRMGLKVKMLADALAQGLA